MQSNEDIAELVGLLETKRNALADRVRRITTHLGTQATSEQRQEDPGALHQGDMVLERLSAEETRDLERIDAALARVHEGTYGLCTRCEEPIARERLIALPWALRCQSCQQAEEQRHL